jgi:hypothetical protein
LRCYDGPMGASASHRHYTLEDYLGVEEMSSVRHEFLDGQIFAMAGGTPEHAALRAALPDGDRSRVRWPAHVSRTEPRRVLRAGCDARALPPPLRSLRRAARRLTMPRCCIPPRSRRSRAAWCPRERRKRTYWNGVLARAEEGAAYRPARRLWRRERMGQYVPSATTRLRVADDDGPETPGPTGAPRRHPGSPVGLSLCASRSVVVA